MSWGYFVPDRLIECGEPRPKTTTGDCNLTFSNSKCRLRTSKIVTTLFSDSNLKRKNIFSMIK